MECKLFKEFSFVYKSKLSDELTEFEHDTIFLGETDEKPIINKTEVSEFKYLTYEDLKKSLHFEPYLYTPWFKIIINKLDESFFSFKNFYQHA